MTNPRTTALALALCASAGVSTGAAAFSQKGSSGGLASPIGHEYLCVRGALDSGAASYKNDGDPAALAKKYAAALDQLDKDGTLEKMGWSKSGLSAKAQGLWYGWGLQTKHEEVLKYSLDAVGKMVAGGPSLNAFSVAVGQRWVDEMGFATAGAVKGSSCFNAVAQEPEENMADHFMRRGDEQNKSGLLAAYNEGIDRFKAYYAAAVAADDGLVPLRDGTLGGGRFYLVNKPYLLLGRAMHLMQDSFSPEHTIRATPGGKDQKARIVLDPPYYTKDSSEADYRQIVDIKDWDCAPGTYQHAHPKLGPGFTPGNMDISGDLIWKPYKQRKETFGAPVGDLKPFARAAYQATVDLYQRFEADHAGKRVDAGALKQFLDKWMTLSMTISYPGKPENEKLHRPACSGKSLDAAARLQKEGPRTKAKDACLKYSGRLGKAGEHDFNHAPYFWTGPSDVAAEDEPALAPTESEFVESEGAKGVKK